MHVHAAPSQHVDLLTWALITITAASLPLFGWLFSFRIDGLSFVKPLLCGAILTLGGLFYRHVRRDERVATALSGAGQLALFASVAAPLSYIAASANLPLWDVTFAQWDKSLGLNWMALLHFMNESQTLHWLFWLAYFSFMLQASAAIIGLAFAGRVAQVRIFILSFIIASLVTIAIATVMPAEGVWGYLKLSSSDHPAIILATRDLHLPIFHGLRDGSLRMLVADGAQGIITFPSLHSGVALIFIFAFWPVQYLRWPALILNVLMIGATPIDGGHYFSDVIAGLVIAVMSWKTSLAVCTRLSRPFATQSPSKYPLNEPKSGIATS